MLPIVATKAVADLDHLIEILIYAIQDEIMYPKILARFLSPDQYLQPDEFPQGIQI